MPQTCHAGVRRRAPSNVPTPARTGSCRLAATPTSIPDSPMENAIVTNVVVAHESADLDPLVAVFTDDVLSLPPLPFEEADLDPGDPPLRQHLRIRPDNPEVAPSLELFRRYRTGLLSVTLNLVDNAHEAKGV
jgi:hypothetical protein